MDESVHTRYQKLFLHTYKVDDILCISTDPDSVLTQIDKYFLLKPDSVDEPDVCFGAKLKLMQLENGVWA